MKRRNTMYYIEDRPGHRVYEGRFTNVGDYCIAIVATVSYLHDDTPYDWAAYIGGAANKGEEIAMLKAAREGNKLSEQDARFYFNGEPFDSTPWRD
jgi:hypothetical protein